jgi:hypothetical protein
MMHLEPELVNSTFLPLIVIGGYKLYDSSSNTIVLANDAILAKVCYV